MVGKRRASVALAVVAVAAAGCSTGGGGAGSGSWCDAVATHDRAVAAADVTVAVTGGRPGEDPGGRVQEADRQLRAAVASIRRSLDDVEDRAPDEIRDAAATVAAFERRYIDALERVGFDLVALLGDPAVLRSEEEEAAIAAVDGAATRLCGSGFDAAGDPPAGAPPEVPEAPIVEPGGAPVRPGGRIPVPPPGPPERPEVPEEP